MATALSELLTRIRQRTDHEHSDSDFITNTELTREINTSYKELYGLLIRHGIQISESVYSITANGATAYALPSNFYAVMAVFRADDTARTVLPRHDWRYKLDSNLTGPACSYRLAGGTIEFDPIPQEGTYELRYVPVPGDLVNPDDTVDGVLGWEEWLVNNVALKVFRKEGNLEAARDLIAERERLEQRIKAESEAVEMTQRFRVQDVRRRDAIWQEGSYTGRRGMRSWLRWR